MTLYKLLVLLLVILLGVFIRLYQLDRIPGGLYTDEASIGYDAYSFMLTGKDQYGKSFPIFLRSFGDFKSPLYTYLTVLPVYFFGLSAFSSRIISSLSGIVIIIMTLFIFLSSKKDKNYLLAFLAAFLIAISPWSVLFSRHALESNLALALFVTSIFLYILSLKSSFYFMIASTLLGISAYAYHAERLFGFIFLICFIWLFRERLFKSRKYLLIGILIFFILQIPQLTIINTVASTRRIDQVNYWTNDFFGQNGGILRSLPLGREVFIIREFSSQYLAYFSPRNLFFEPDSQIIRSIPDLSIFYSWMVLPFLFGIKAIWKYKQEPVIKIIILTIFISLIPAALTRDPFYTERALPLLWGLTLVIAIGFYNIIQYLPNLFLKISIFSIMIAISFISLYSSYFVLLKYERSNEYGYPFIELVKKTEQLHNEKFVVDTGRRFASYIYFAFYKKYDPGKFQANVDRTILDNYYTNTEFNEPHVIDNVEVRPIAWKTDTNKRQILVGDTLAISEKQASEHKLTPSFEIKDLTGIVRFKAYSTNPELILKEGYNNK